MASSAVPAAGLAMEGGDPRLRPHDSEVHVPEPPMDHTPREDDSVTFEEYMYWATVTRAEEKQTDQEWRQMRGPTTVKSVIKGRFSKGIHHDMAKSQGVPPPGSKEAIEMQKPSKEAGEKSSSENGNGKDTGDASNSMMAPPPYDNAEGPRWGVSEEEWKRASRATRTAGWGSIFYLITTDILGPFSTPWAFAQMGYGPGVALYTVFGVFSYYSGWILWKVFLGLDSDRYPLRNYADMFYRIYGRWAQHFINVGQSIQLLLTLSVLILSNGQAISEMSQGPSHHKGICFIACLIIFMAAGFVLGQIRTLQRFGWLANFSVWVNVLSLLFIIGLVVHYPPNFSAVIAQYGPQWGPGPIKTYAGTPPDGAATGGNGFTASLNGLDQAVYSYAGAMLFVAFMAEMRHPMDFWKGLLCAEIFIYVVYMFFGIFVYSFHGQFCYNPAPQGISSYGWQTALNTMSLVTGLIAAALYGNIGLKVAYVEVFEKLLGAPGLTKKGGKIWWSILTPIYWGIAFVVAAAVPQFSLISSLIGAIFLLSFTYTFPALLAVGYWIRKDGMDESVERFDPSTRTYNYIDTGIKRLWRGFMQKPFFNTFNTLYFLGALVTTALGIYSSVTSLMGAFNSGVATSFTCKSPV